MGVHEIPLGSEAQNNSEIYPKMEQFSSSGDQIGAYLILASAARKHPMMEVR
jgi:hypothetical protein